MTEGMRTYAEGIEFTAEIPEEFQEILAPEAVAFVAGLSREYRGRVVELLDKRAERQERINAGEMPDFLSETRDVREGDWKIAPIPDDLQDRRVELTGPPDRKMTINALNSGANCWMADFEDANCPTWHNMLESQLNMKEAIERTITFDDPKSGKRTAPVPSISWQVAHCARVKTAAPALASPEEGALPASRVLPARLRMYDTSCHVC